MSVNQDAQYRDVVATFGAALARLAEGYERDVEARKDLVQEIHFSLWRSFATFDARCSVRTWMYRVAHNVAASHVMRDTRRTTGLVGLESLEREATGALGDVEAQMAERVDMAQQRVTMLRLIDRLAPLDREIVLLYLEGLDANAIGVITGISSMNVSTKVHRIKRILSTAVRMERVVAHGK